MSDGEGLPPGCETVTSRLWTRPSWALVYGRDRRGRPLVRSTQSRPVPVKSSAIRASRIAFASTSCWLVP